MSATGYTSVLLAPFLLSSCCMHTITPVESTNSAIIESFARVQLYAKANRVAPPSLDALPKRKGYANQITDGWHRPLHYRLASDGVITLTSLGKDGKPGGTGEDADISVSYRSRRPDGSLWAASDSWIGEAQVK